MVSPFKRLIMDLSPSTGQAIGEVDVVALQHAAGQVGGVADTLAELLEGGVLVAEGGQELERELRPLKGLEGEVGKGMFDF